MGRCFAVLLAASLFAVIAPAQAVAAARPSASAPLSSASTSPHQLAAGAHERSPAAVAPKSLSTGGSWSWQNPTPNGNSLVAISCPTASTCFTAGDDGPILMTANGGSTWTQQAHAAGVNGISCASATICVAVGDGGLLMSTVNAGALWVTHFPQVNNGGFLSSVSCPTVSACFAAGFGGSILYISTSSGGIGPWMAQYSGTSANLFGISCPSALVCYAVGAGGVITGTVNGGANWSVQTSNTTSPLHAVSCPTTANCAAVGAQGTIVSTTGAPNVWAFVGSETRADLLGISCPSTTICFSAGSDGEVHAGFAAIYGNSSVGANGRLWAISCPTATECLTSGDFGTVALTTNGGSGWSQQLSGIPNTVAGMSCPSTTVCFAVDGGTILGTTNGGTSWVQQLTAPTSFTSISCSSTSSCFAAGGPIAAALNPTMIWKTSDGGAHWTSEYTQPFAGDQLTSISCATATNCVAVEHNTNITRTTDGVNWSTPAFGPCCPSLGEVTCPSASVCFLAANVVPGQVWYSGDGGATWTLSFDVANDPQSGGGNGLTVIACPSVAVCYAAGPGPASPGPGGAYATTTDGGVTWRTDFGPSSTSVTGISCPNTGTCYVSATGASIFHTADFGGTWDVQLGTTNAWYLSVSCPSTTTCFAGGGAGSAGGIISATTTAGAAWTRPQPAGSISNINGRALDCASSSDCYAAAFNNILVSHNGGSTWAAHTLTNGDQLDGMKCVSTTTCYAVGWPGAIYKTIDGGTSWTSSPNPRSGQDTTLLAVSCWGASACVAVGTNGDILSSGDGSSWGLEAATTTNNLFGVNCPSSSLCIAVGDNGTVLIRTGNSWHAGASGTAVVLDSVTCATTTTCYAVGQAGTMLVTNNQGATWTAQSSGVTRNLFGIACVRPTFCLAAGSAGTAIATLDGVHWQGLAMPTTNDLHAVALPDPNHAWLAGSGGTILANPTFFPYTCTSVIDSAAPPSPSQSGTSVTFTASASGCPQPQYLFWILAPGSSTWTVAQTGSPSNTFTWSTVGLAPGTYAISVWIVDATSSGSSCTNLGCYDAFAPGYVYTLTSTACNSVTASAAPASPQVAGTGVTITASAPGCPNPQYEFWIQYTVSSTWWPVQTYSSMATFSWDTTGLPGGLYHYSVWVRDASSASSYDAYFPGTAYTLTATSCASVTASAAPASPQPASTTVTITASASGCPNARYEFWILAPGGSWTIARAYSSNASFTWNTTPPAGVYHYSVWVRDASSAASYDAYFPGTAYTLTTTPCTSVTASAAPASTATRGATVVITASASGCSNALYEFWILAPGGNWMIAQPYSISATFNWNTTGLAAGTYHYSVWVRDASSAASYDAFFPGTTYTLT